MHLVKEGKGQIKELVKPNITTKNLKVKGKVQVLGYVLVQIANVTRGSRVEETYRS